MCLKAQQNLGQPLLQASLPIYCAGARQPGPAPLNHLKDEGMCL